MILQRFSRSLIFLASGLFRSFSISALILVLIQHQYCFADQVKIIDTLELTRAIRTVAAASTVSVVVQVSESGLSIHPESITLSNIDGLVADISAVRAGEDVYKFRGVAAGVWKIALPESTGRLLQVKINSQEE